MSTTDSASTDDLYDYRTFTAAVDDEGHAAPETREWIQAEAQGFHEGRLVDASVDRLARHLVEDGHRLTSVIARSTHPHAGLPGALGSDAPVATFASFERTANLGGELLPTHLISAVTVRPTHRRRGILRRMMTDDLRQAVADGYPLAALTVSEATIYRRFGFGLATTVHAVEVATDARFRLLVEPAGRCELIDPRAVLELGPVVFERFHAAHPGSVDRRSKHWGRVSGLEGEKGGDDPEVRAAAHYDDDGEIDGFVSYRFRGWDVKPRTLEIVDLVAADGNAYLGLWEFLASVDLVERVTWEAAPADDPLRWALADWRVVSTTSVDDWLWLRVLDPVRAFEARRYEDEVEGGLVLEVSDALGYAAGRFRMHVAGGRATVTPDAGAVPDLALDVAELGSLLLGGVDPRTLTAAGLVRELVPGAARRAHTLLLASAPVWGITHF